MKQQAVVFTLLLTALGTARAQGPAYDKVIVNLPYPLTIQDKILQPGEYTIEEDRGPGPKDYILRIYSDSGMKLQTAVMTVPALKDSTPSETSLVLDHYGKDYYIDQVWIQGKDYGYQFQKPEILKAREREQRESTSLPARYVRAANAGLWPKPDADRTYMAADRGPLPAQGLASLTPTPNFTNDLVNGQVRHELTVLPHYGVFDNLTFRVDGDTVTLLGQVTRATLKSDAENAVKKVEGISKVVNDIQILPPSTGDDQLRTSVYRAIYGNASMPSDSTQSAPPIHIIVNGGAVTLEGSVTSQADKDMAYIQATSVTGVISVANDLRVGS